MYIVSYDIENDKLRNKISNLLCNYGIRQQYSVFECLIDKKDYEKMYSDLENLFKDSSENDSIRIYKIYSPYDENIKVFGKNIKSPYEGDITVL
jgi:CRISPR-associated protein Cas2